jgi:transposase
MGKPHPVELRQRVVDHVAEGSTHRATAARFKVSVKFVNDMVKLRKATGGLLPKAQGNGGGYGKLSSLKDWVARRIAEKPDLTAAGLAAEIAATHGMTVHRGSVWRLLRELGLTHKKRPAGRAFVRHWFKHNGERAEAPRDRHPAPHLDFPAATLHGQHVDADRLY